MTDFNCPDCGADAKEECVRRHGEEAIDRILKPPGHDTFGANVLRGILATPDSAILRRHLRSVERRATKLREAVNIAKDDIACMFPDRVMLTPPHCRQPGEAASDFVDVLAEKFS